MIIMYVQVPYDDDRINMSILYLYHCNIITISRERERGREREREQTRRYACAYLFPFCFSYYCNATFFLLRCVDSFRLPMMFREQLCGSLGHEAWLLWGHHPLSHRTTVLLAKKRLRGTAGIIM